MTEPPLPRVLVVDDTADIRDLLLEVLSRRGFTVLAADGGVEMDRILAAESVDIIILDSMMPGEDGLSICRRISEAGGPPIIMLSAKGDRLDRIGGLELGAQDYVAKPFDADELSLRIRAVLRRAAPPPAPPAVQAAWSFCGWTLDRDTRKLTSPVGKILALSPAEFALLRVFIEGPDKPLRRDYILENMEEVHDFTTPRGLDTLVSRLRRKLQYAHPGASAEEELIQTVYGVGYVLRPRPA
ncbi:response regulator [Asticcacaulis solisilvae]|uniref:response regulator n=1 Tax=Asticcacaulis solisilvae TaxID=1217274 RepID=UPI003FD7347C